MASLLLLAAGLVVLAGVQSGIGSVWRPLGVRPDLVLVALIVLGVLRGPRWALFAALIGGLALDALSVLPIGTQVIALGVAAPITAFRARSGESASIMLPLLLTPVATFLYNGMQLIEVALLGRPVLWGAWVGQAIVPLMLINTLCVPLFWAPAGLFRRHRRGFVLQR